MHSLLSSSVFIATCSSYLLPVRPFIFFHDDSWVILDLTFFSTLYLLRYATVKYFDLFSVALLLRHLPVLVADYTVTLTNVMAIKQLMTQLSNMSATDAYTSPMSLAFPFADIVASGIPIG